MKTEKDYIEDILPDELREIYFTEDDQTAYEEPMKDMPQQPSEDQPPQAEKQGGDQGEEGKDKQGDFPDTVDSEEEIDSAEPKTAIDYEKQSTDEIKDAKTMINGIIAELEGSELNTPDEYEALVMDLSLAQEKLDWAGKILHRVGKMVGEKQKIQKQINPQVPESPAAPPSMR